MTGERRHAYMDGLRGIAALLVMVEHLSVLFPVGAWSVGSQTVGMAASAFLNFPFRAGTFSVYLFFVMSGIVISRSVSGYKPWPLSLASRYLRLTVPMVVASFFACALLTVFPGEMPLLAKTLPNHWTQTVYQGAVPSALAAAREAAFDIYWNGKAPINPVIWSMRIELYGSFAILTFYRFVPRWARLKGILGITAVLPMLGLSQYVTFSLGALLYELNERVSFRWPAVVGLTAIITGTVFGALATSSEAHSSGLGAQMGEPNELHVSGLLNTIGAVIVVAAVMGTEFVRNLLAMGLPRFAGRISYSLYLTHMPLFYTVIGAAYLAFPQPLAPTVMAGIALGSIGVAIVAGYVMTVGLDEPITKIVRVSGRPQETELGPLDGNVGQSLSRKLIDQAQHPELPSIVGSVSDEIVGPDMIGPIGP